MFNMIGDKLEKILDKYIDREKLYEIRLRSESPASVNYGGRYMFLTNTGASAYSRDAYIFSAAELEETVLRASNYSLYSVGEQLKQGFITIEGGLRLGICGECVFDNGKIVTVKNISSVNLRIPHEVKGCADRVYEYITDRNQVKNTLIISPPGKGKTTVLRDLTRQISDKLNKNILLADERNEISASKQAPTLDVGKTTDVLRFCDKNYAFTTGIRVLKPDVIVTDELFGAADWNSAEVSVFSGVNLIASAHSESLDTLRKNGCFKAGIFDRYVILSSELGMGTVSQIFDGNFCPLYQLS